MNGLLETFLGIHGNIPMKMLVYDLMRLLIRERSVMLWEHLMLAGFALQSRAPLKEVITGVVLSVEKDQLKCKIPCVCDTRHLVRSRPGGECGVTEKTLSVLLSFVAESLPDKVKLGCASYTRESFVPNPLQCFKCQAYCSNL